QIPSLLLSLATAIIVTRVTTSESISEQASEQLANPTALFISAVILLILGMVPGMPHLMFIALALASAGLGLMIIAREVQDEKTEKEEQEFRAHSDKARAAVDARLLTSFDRIRKNFRNGKAVVPVLRDACGGCYNAIPPQRQSEIRQHKKIIVCENCGRILVDEEHMQ
ncbi:MAG: FHIPEP family type III secretion protein, partial [Chitinophagaceae bacterium]